MPDHRWLVMRLEAPILAFGGVTIDHVGAIRDFPALSMLTGLLANALGWRRTDWQKHQALQDRLVFATRCDRVNELGRLTDIQNARIGDDKGWTTFGQPEGRRGASYGAPHRRQREYHADASVVVVLRLNPAGEKPDLDALATAIIRPVRPLFVGRKPCLPSAPINRGFIVAADAHSALGLIAPAESGDRCLRACWPLYEGPSDGDAVECIIDVPDLRNWRSGLHGGSRKVVEGRVTLQREEAFA